MRTICFLFVAIFIIVGCAHNMNLDNFTINKSIKITKNGNLNHLVINENRMTGKVNVINILYPLNIKKEMYSLNDLDLIVFLGHDSQPAQIDLKSSKFEIVFADAQRTKDSNNATLEIEDQISTIRFNLRFKNSSKALKGEAHNIKVINMHQSNEIPISWGYKAREQ